MRYVHKGCMQVHLMAHIVHEWINVSEISRISIFQSWQLCLREHNNPHDHFAVAGKTMLKGKIAPVTVGHVPRELARYVWYAIMEGAKFEAVVQQEKEKPSPLVQGGLEIIIKMKATWGSQEKLTILSAKVVEIAYPVDDDYKDDSKEILKMLQVEEDDDDEEEAEENF